MLTLTVIGSWLVSEAALLWAVWRGVRKTKRRDAR
jgi:hypothetical protein